MDPIKEIKDKLNIVDVIGEYIHLTPAGKNFKALCPFHKEKTPSFIVSPERQTWRCFGQCNEGGDIFSFIMKYEGIEFYDALKMLSEKAGVELKKISPRSQKEFGILYDINKSASDFFKNNLLQSKEALEYLKNRGIKQESIEEFSIGFSPIQKDALSVYLINAGYSIDDISRSGLIYKMRNGMLADRFSGRIILPIFNTFGKAIGFSGRILPQYDNGKQAKYINSPDTLLYNKSNVLYGYNFSKKYIKEKNSVIIVEGNFDEIMLWQDGVKNCVAISGTALTEKHLQILSRITDNIVFALDNDEAGKHATERAIDMANSMDLYPSVILWDNVKDGAEFVEKNPGMLKRYIAAHTVSSLDFYLGYYIKGKKINEIDKKDVRLFLQKALKLKSSVERGKWINKLSESTGIKESYLIDELKIISSKNKEYVNNVNENSNKKSDIKFKTRRDALSFNILLLYYLNKNLKDKIYNYRHYFADKFWKIIEYMSNGNINNNDKKIDKIIEYIEGKASLLNGDIDNNELEVDFLLKELKKEFLMEKKDELHKKINEAEKAGNEKKINILLKEFDEIVKLLNTLN